MTKVFYHNDPDGWCSAFWVRKYLEEQKIPFTKEDFIEMNYDREFPRNVLTVGERVYMVDFCLNSVEDMFNLNHYYDLIWIDHHKSAIEKIRSSTVCKEVFSGIRWDGIAACALTWSYFFHELADKPFGAWDKLHTPDEIMEGMPLFTQYIHLWDTWQWKNHPDATKIEAFIVSLTGVDTHPLSKLWDKLSDMTIFNDDYDREGEHHLKGLVASGRSMLGFRDGYAAGLCKGISKVIEFEGFRCCVCNMGHVSSEWFKSVDPSTYDIMMPFYYNAQTNQFCFSLYTTNPDIDVSKIAVKYGGGGHRGSAGFQIKTLEAILPC